MIKRKRKDIRNRLKDIIHYWSSFKQMSNPIKSYYVGMSFVETNLKATNVALSDYDQPTNTYKAVSVTVHNFNTIILSGMILVSFHDTRGIIIASARGSITNLAPGQEGTITLTLNWNPGKTMNDTSTVVVAIIQLQILIDDKCYLQFMISHTCIF